MEHDGKILLLHRLKNKSEGNRWGLPGGKIDQGENKHQAMVREIREETGVRVFPENLEYIVKLYVKYPKYHFVYHIFRLTLNKLPKLKLRVKEHKGFKWIAPKDATKYVLLHKRDDKAKVNPNQWAFFGGLSERNETPKQTFVRELKEELNLDINPIKKIAETPGDVPGQTTYWWTCEARGDIKINTEEIAEAGYFTLEEMEKMNIWPANKQIFSKYINS